MTKRTAAEPSEELRKIARIDVVETDFGPARVRLEQVEAPRAALVLGHGAGGGVDSPDLQATAAVARQVGVAVALVEQPYRVAGRRSPAPARQLDAAWLTVIASLTLSKGGPLAALPLLVGGRSSGARVACRTAAQVGAEGVLCLAFPLHPPGRGEDPTASRLPELEAVVAPVLVVQGERDPFGRPPAAPGREVAVIPGTHALRSRQAVGEVVRAWLSRRLP